MVCPEACGNLAPSPAAGIDRSPYNRAPMPAVSFQQVEKTYAGARGNFRALDGVTFDIQQGEFFGLLGPNGAGKTTLISILAGLTKPTAGRVTVMGHDVQRDEAAARQSLGIVPQELVFDPFFNVRETLRFQSGYFGVRDNEAWIDELLQRLGRLLQIGGHGQPPTSSSPFPCSSAPRLRAAAPTGRP